MSDSLWPHGLQHARFPCLSSTPGAYSNSCRSSWWCHPVISSSVIPFSSCLQFSPSIRVFSNESVLHIRWPKDWSFSFSISPSLVAQTVKRLPTMRETWVQSLGWEDLLEKEMATHCSILAWKIPWMEEPGRLQSMGSQRVKHHWATSLISSSNEYSGQISFKMDWLDLLAVQGTESPLQHHSSKAPILQRSASFIVQLSHPCTTTGKAIALTRRTFVGEVTSPLFKMLSSLVGHSFSSQD